MTIEKERRIRADIETNFNKTRGVMSWSCPPATINRDSNGMDNWTPYGRQSKALARKQSRRVRCPYRNIAAAIEPSEQAGAQHVGHAQDRRDSEATESSGHWHNLRPRPRQKT